MTDKDIAGCRMAVVRGDLTAQEVDAIVNAANEQLAHGGGVAAAIARAGGPSIQADSDSWVAEHGEVARGTAAVTGGGDLAARWVIHTVGPRYREGADNAPALRDAVAAALQAAAGVGARSIAMPAISAGIFGYPAAEATQVIAEATEHWLVSHPGLLDEVRLVAYDEAMAAHFETAVTGL